MRNFRNYFFKNVFGFSFFQGIEMQRVEYGNGFSIYCKNVLEDIVDFSSSILEWFDGGWVVVGFDFESEFEFVVQVYDFGIFFWFNKDMFICGGKLFEERVRVFVVVVF